MKKNSSYWYCPRCKEELDGCHVTYQELCEYCGTAVLSVPEGISQGRLEEIIEAETEGRLVVLPCKVGDEIFSFKWSIKNEKYEVHTGKIKNVRYDSSDGLVTVSDGERYCVFGKTVFLSREEAEKALQEGSE